MPMTPQMIAQAHEIDQLLEMVQGKIHALAGECDLRHLPPTIAIILRRKRSNVSYIREDIRSLPKGTLQAEEQLAQERHEQRQQAAQAAQRKEPAHHGKGK